MITHNVLITLQLQLLQERRTQAEHQISLDNPTTVAAYIDYLNPVATAYTTPTTAAAPRLAAPLARMSPAPDGHQPARQR